VVDPGEGPFLQAALVCERVLTEQDGVLSLIRVVDRFFQREINTADPEQMPPFTVNATIAIMLKAGAARGRQTLRLRPEVPAGIRLPEVSAPVFFEGEERGVNLLLPMQFQAAQEGLYWFDVILEDRLLTRIPLRVVYQPTPTTGSSAGP